MGFHTPARKRLITELKKLHEDPPTDVSGTPFDGDILRWICLIFGPPETPFEDGIFKLSVVFPEEYPSQPPIVKFVSKMFHPNVNADGDIFLDILQNRWSPVYNVETVLTSIRSLLDAPNPDSPANGHAARLFRENKREYGAKVRQTVEQSWSEADKEEIVNAFETISIGDDDERMRKRRG